MLIGQRGAGKQEEALTSKVFNTRILEFVRIEKEIKKKRESK